MPKFQAYGKVVGTKYLGEYEAPTEEAAREMAWRDAHSSMCHQCSSECEDPEIDEVIVDLSETPQQERKG